MKQIKCDGCGKTCSIESNTMLTLVFGRGCAPTSSTFSTGVYDVCIDCANLIKKLLVGKNDTTNKTC